MILTFPQPSVHYLSPPAPVVSRLRTRGYEVPDRAMVLRDAFSMQVRKRDAQGRLADGFSLNALWPGTPEAVERGRRYFWSTMQTRQPEPRDDYTFSGLPLGNTSYWSGPHAEPRILAFGQTSSIEAGMSLRIVRPGVFVSPVSDTDRALVEECARWLSAWAEGLDAAGGPKAAASLRTVRLRSGVSSVRLADVAASRRLSLRVANGVASVGSTILPLGALRMKVGGKWVPTGGPIACLQDGTILIPAAAVAKLR